MTLSTSFARVSTFSAAVAMTFVASGCGGGAEVPDTAPVSGVITLDGAPVEGANVTFTPSSQDPEAKPAYGTTDANGKYTLATTVPGGKADGAVPGKHRITVTKIKAAETTDNGSGEYGTDSYVPAGATGVPQEDTGPEYIVPQRYGSKGTSGLEATVEASGENTFNFDLTTEE